MDVTLRQLEHFRAIAENESLREAAASIRVAESTIASALDQLERTTGVQLCVRRKARGIALTADGRRVAVLASELLDHAQAIRAEISDLAGEVSGPVAIGCTPGLAPTILPPIVAAMRDSHPGVELRLATGTSAEFLPQLRRGEVDLVVLPGGPVPTGLASAALLETPVHAVLPAGHSLAAAEVVSLHDLADEPLILLDVDESAARVLQLFGPLGIAPEIAFRSTNFELVRSLVARGLGYSLQLQRPWGDRSYEGLPLAVRPLSPAQPGDVIRIAWPAAASLPTRTRAVVESAQAVLPVTRAAPR